MYLTKRAQNVKNTIGAPLDLNSNRDDSAKVQWCGILKRVN